MASLEWSPPANSAVAGYYVYYGADSGSGFTKLDVGTNTTYQVAGLQQGMTYYFQVTSYSINGVESVPTSLATMAPIPFLAGGEATARNIDYLQFPNGNIFGYYAPVGFPWIYHMDLGYEFLIDAADGAAGVYSYDYSSGDWWYSSPTLFPYVYDFALNAWLWYYPNTNEPGHYTTNPRYFYNFGTSQVITR